MQKKRQQSREKIKFQGEIKAKQPPTKYVPMQFKTMENPMVDVKPSDLLVTGEYPFSNYTDNIYTHVMFGKFQHFHSGDRKFFN